MTQAARTIAIASGKGGTGKTTIATNLAWVLAQAGRQVQYLDCDVEEPNGHIFLPPVEVTTEAVTVPVPEVDLSKCTGCGACSRLCQFSAIVVLKQNVLTFDNLCHCCGGCMLICPEQAIRERGQVIGYLEQGVCRGVAIVQGRLEIGDVRTPALIKQVKRKIVPGGLAIIDAPPGTSCPVVETVKDVDYVMLVTEPTPFGLHDLKLAVGMVRELGRAFSVVINRSDLGDRRVHEYCRENDIEVILELPNDRKVAEAYSSGRLMAEAWPQYREAFSRLAETLGAV